MTETTEKPNQIVDTVEDAEEATTEPVPAEEPDTTEPDLFPREVVEKLRQENAKYRHRAQQADSLAERLHTELVRATGKLADPTDLPFSPEHLDDPEALAGAVEDLLVRKPHLAARRPSGDIGQGRRGTASSEVSLADILRART